MDDEQVLLWEKWCGIYMTQLLWVGYSLDDVQKWYTLQIVEGLEDGN